MNKQSISGLTQVLTTGFAILALSLTTLSLSSCSSSDDDEILEDLSEDSVEDMLIGTWYCTSGYYRYWTELNGEVQDDSKVTYTGCTWTIEENGDITWTDDSSSVTMYWLIEDGQFILRNSSDIIAGGLNFDITVTSSSLYLLMDYALDCGNGLYAYTYMPMYFTRK